MCIVTKIDPKSGFKPLESPEGATAPLRVVEGPPKPLPAAPRTRHEYTSDSSYEPSPPPSPEPIRRLGSRRRTGPRPKHPHIVTQHNYHDHSKDPLTDNEHLQSPHDRNGQKQHHHMMAFPLKLYDMLERVEAEGSQSVVSWQTHGRCFVVHDVPQFKQLLPSYFKLSKIASFQRQLNLYGFQRLTVGPDKGGYYHELFLRGRIDLVASIQRVKVKGTGVRAKANPADEPNLYLYPAVDGAAAVSVAKAADVDVDVDMATSDKKVPPREEPTRVPDMPFPSQMLTSQMMMVTRDYDKVQDSLEQKAERLLADQKPLPMPAKSQGLLEQTTSAAQIEALVSESRNERRPIDVNFDRLIDEMFRHDQSLDFADLLRLAAV